MPKKAKKGEGGGGKTEEERLLLLQQRAQAEEEVAKKKEEILALFLKDKLQKEERNTAVNQLKLNDVWRSTLRRTRAAELQEEITVLTRTFERQVDELDSVSQNVERNLEEAERRLAQGCRVHLQDVERLVDLQTKRVMCLQDPWENLMQDHQSSLISEREQALARYQQQRATLEDAMFTVEKQHEEVISDTLKLYTDFITSRETTEKDRKAAQAVEDKKKLKGVHRVESPWSLMMRTLRPHWEPVDFKPTEVNLTKTQKTLAKVKLTLDSKKLQRQSVEEELRASRNQASQRIVELRDQVAQGQTEARKQLTDVSVQSAAAAKELQAAAAKGEKVLRVAELCSKLESEQTRVFVLSTEEQRSRPEEEEPAVTCELQPLMRRTNAVVVQQEALYKRRHDLSRENQQLRLLLRRRLDAMTLSDHTLDGRHALLTVYQAPTVTAPSDAARLHPVIEAAHAIRHSVYD